MGFQSGLLAKLTKGLWAPMAAHFVNNTIVNLLHVTAQSGTDEMLSMRLTIAQTLSFVIVLIFYIRSVKKERAMQQA